MHIDMLLSTHIDTCALHGKARRGGLSPGPFGSEPAARSPKKKNVDGPLDIIFHCLLHKSSDSAGVESDVFRTGVGRIAKTSDSILADDISNEQIQLKMLPPPNPTRRGHVSRQHTSCRGYKTVAPAPRSRRVARAWARPNDRSEDIVSTPLAPLGYERIFRTYAGICFLAFFSVTSINI